MCGIWGFKGHTDAKNLAAIIERADERGGHGFGFFGITSNNEHVYHVSHGRVDVNLLVKIAMKCKVGIGHSRLVTGGDMQIMNSQPVLADGIALVHNGNILDHKEVMSKYNYTPRTTLDSEALVPMIKNEQAKIVGAYLAIEYGKYDYTLRSYNLTLPLVHKRIKQTDYYCSKSWEARY